MAGQLLRLLVTTLCTLTLITAAKLSETTLSPQARQIYKQVMDNLKGNEGYSPTPPDLILTSGHLREHFADYGNKDTFAKQLFVRELVNAKEEVLITTFVFAKESPTAQGIRDAVLELEKRAAARKKKVRFYLAYDPVGTAFFQGSMLPVEALTSTDLVHYDRVGLPDPSELQWVDLKVIKCHKGALGALHSKMMLIDGKTAIMGSKNLDGDICFEYMFVIDGQLARSLRADFAKVWNKPIPDLVTPALPYSAKTDVPMLVLSRPEADHDLQNNVNVPQDQGWLAAMKVAEKNVYIQSPNFCDANMADAVLDAIINRKVSVTIVTAFRQNDRPQRFYYNSYGNNGQTMNAMYEKLQAEAPTLVGKLRWCWFIGKRVGNEPEPSAEEWSHVKFMTIDEKMVILGSGNQDPQSWYHSRENNVLIDSLSLTSKMKQTILAPQQTLKHCYHGKDDEERAV